MSAKLGRAAAQELLSTVLWVCLLHAMHVLNLPRPTAVLLALAMGTALAVPLALLGWWAQRPMTAAPGWELAARVTVWFALTTAVVLTMLLISVSVGIGLYAAVIVAVGVPIVRQCRTVSRPRPRRHDDRVWSHR